MTRPVAASSSCQYGILLLIEAVRQLRGECGAGQVQECPVVLVHANAVVYSAGVAVILGDGQTV